MATQKPKPAISKRTATKKRCSACRRLRVVGNCAFNTKATPLGAHCIECCDAPAGWKAAGGGR